jgi:hypothetical protein
MYSSPKVVLVLLILVAGGVAPAIALQTQSPPGAQPPTSPTQVQNPAPNQPLSEQAPADSRAPVATPAPARPSVQTPPIQMPSQGNSTMPPAPKSPVEPSAAAGESTEPPPQPKTELLDTSDTSGALATDGHDPILDPPPFPKGQTTLVGGIISSVDRVHNHLNIAVFGGGHWTLYFDERTHIFRKGVETTQLALKKGERIYVDTMLDNNKHDIFARNIRLGVVTAPADAAGQIVEVNDQHREIAFRDSIGGQTVHFTVAPDALISNGSQPASLQDLHPGSLVRVKFAPERSGRGLAKEIAIVAVRGSSFTFAGVVTFLDTHRGILALRSPGDNRTYDLHFTPVKMDPERRLAVGAEVQVVATFDGTQYTAQQITVNKMAGATAQ